MKEFADFGLVSNFKVNFDKMEALNISLSSMERSRLCSNFPFKWQPLAIKYLGVHIPATLSKLSDLNYTNLLTLIHTCLKSYDRPIIS